MRVIFALCFVLGACGQAHGMSAAAVIPPAGERLETREIGEGSDAEAQCPPAPPCRCAEHKAIDEDSDPCTSEAASLGPKEQTDDASALEFRIEPVRPSSKKELRLVLKNVSRDEWLWVSMRMRMGPRGADDVWLEVIHTRTGQRLDVACDASGGLRHREDYVHLGQGELFSVVRSLPCMIFPDKGPWRITAHFKDDNPRPPRPPPVTKWFSGELVSNTIEIEVPPDPPRR